MMNYHKPHKGLAFVLIALVFILGVTSCAPKPAAPAVGEEPARRWQPTR